MLFLQPKNGIFQMPDPAGWVQGKWSYHGNLILNKLSVCLFCFVFSLTGKITPEQKLSFKQALLSHMVSTNAFHFTNLFLFSCHHIPTNSIAPFSEYKFTRNSNSSDEGLLCLKCQLFNSTQWPIYIISSVNNIKLPFNTLLLMQHHSFFRNLPPLPAQQSSTQHELTEKIIPLF